MKIVPRDAGEWKLPADSVLSGMYDACIVHLDKCYAGIPGREAREARFVLLAVKVGRTSQLIEHVEGRGSIWLAIPKAHDLETSPVTPVIAIADGEVIPVT